MKKWDKLSHKQELFAAEVVRCGNQSEAYRKVFDAYDTPPEHVWVESRKVAMDPRVALRIRELKDDIEKACKITKVKMINELQNIAAAAMAKDDHSAAVNAIDKIMKAMGYYAPTKVAMDVNVQAQLVSAANRLAAAKEKQSRTIDTIVDI